MDSYDSEKTFLLKDNEYVNSRCEHESCQTENRTQQSELDKIAVGCILMTELCERLTFYSVVSNMILFCTKLEMESSTATTVNLIFTGSVYIVPIFGGYIADTKLGKYNTILASGFINILGLFLLLVSAIDYNALIGNAYRISAETRTIFFTISLILIAVGTGGVKANIGTFGAEQVECRGPQAVQSFFNWFYWFINIGAFIALTGVAYVQQNMGFVYGFIIPLVIMVISQICLLTGKNRYITAQADGSVLSEAVYLCWSSRCKKFKLEYSSLYNQESVDRVAALIRILPVFGFVVVYWAVYSQMNTTYYLQSERMDIRLGTQQVPVAVLISFNVISVFILIPVMEMVVYPCLAMFNRSPTHLQKMGIGMIFSTLSVLVAGIVEIYRKKEISVRQIILNDQYNASSMSVLVQIPQFTLIGISEVFTSIGGLEFAYSEAPDLMQGVCMGLFLETQGLGTYLSVILLYLVQQITGTEPPNSWFPNDLNNGKTQNLFFLLAVLMAVNFFMFIIVAHYYKYRRSSHRSETIVKQTNIQTSAIESPVRYDIT